MRGVPVRSQISDGFEQHAPLHGSCRTSCQGRRRRKQRPAGCRRRSEAFVPARPAGGADRLGSEGLPGTDPVAITDAGASVPVTRRVTTSPGRPRPAGRACAERLAGADPHEMHVDRGVATCAVAAPGWLGEHCARRAQPHGSDGLVGGLVGRNGIVVVVDRGPQQEVVGRRRTRSWSGRTPRRHALLRHGRRRGIRCDSFDRRRARTWRTVCPRPGRRDIRCAAGGAAAGDPSGGGVPAHEATLQRSEEVVVSSRDQRCVIRARSGEHAEIDQRHDRRRFVPAVEDQRRGGREVDRTGFQAPLERDDMASLSSGSRTARWARSPDRREPAIQRREATAASYVGPFAGPEVPSAVRRWSGCRARGSGSVCAESGAMGDDDIVVLLVAARSARRRGLPRTA